jgi:hypothetical protein
LPIRADLYGERHRIPGGVGPVRAIGGDDHLRCDNPGSGSLGQRDDGSLDGKQQRCKQGKEEYRESLHAGEFGKETTARQRISSQGLDYGMQPASGLRFLGTHLQGFTPRKLGVHPFALTCIPFGDDSITLSNNLVTLSNNPITLSNNPITLSNNTIILSNNTIILSIISEGDTCQR